MRKSSRILSMFMSFVLVFTMLYGMNVNAAAKSKLNKTKVTIKVGQTVKLKVKSNKKKVKWSSKNKKVATVSKAGKVKGKKQGKTYIIAKVGKKKYKCRVIVKKNIVNPVPTTKPVEATKPVETTKPNVPGETTKPEVPTTTPSKPDSSASDFGFNTSGSGVTINKYYGKSATVVIPAEIAGKKVTAISEAAFQEGDDSAVRITSVVIPETVTSIGRLGFANCKYLKTLEIKGNGLKTIGGQAFDQCVALGDVKLPSSVQSIGEYAFAGCQTMTIINIPASIASIGGGPFSGCTNLQNIIIDEGAKILPSFAYRTSLKSIVLPTSITKIDASQFSGCSGLEKAEIKGAVKTITSEAFCDCTSLREVILSEEVEVIDEYAFYGCTSLETIRIPASVTNIASSAFEECTALKTIEGVKGSYAETFANNNGLTFVEK